MELLEPNVSTYEKIGGLVCNIIVLTAYPLFHYAALYNIGSSNSIGTVVLKLGDAEERCVGALKPTYRLHNAEVVRTRSACGLLCHAQARDIQKIDPYGVRLHTAIEAQDVGVIGFVVMVGINGHDGVWLIGISRCNTIVFVEIADEHNSMVVDCVGSIKSQVVSCVIR